MRKNMRKNMMRGGSPRPDFFVEKSTKALEKSEFSDSLGGGTGIIRVTVFQSVLNKLYLLLSRYVS